MKWQIVLRRADRSGAAASHCGRRGHSGDDRRAGDDRAAAQAKAAARAPAAARDRAPEAAGTGVTLSI